MFKNNSIIYIGKSAFKLEVTFKDRNGNLKSFGEYFLNKTSAEARLKQIGSKFQILTGEIRLESSLKG